jgi:hypothetical protein
MNELTFAAIQKIGKKNFLVLPHHLRQSFNPSRKFYCQELNFQVVKRFL